MILLFNTLTRQISYETEHGFINIPDEEIQIAASENTIVYPFMCMLGVVKIETGSKYLFFCSESESLGTFHEEEIFSIVRVEYLPLTDASLSEPAENIKNLIESLHFYYTFDKIDEDFLWNGNMLENFKKFVEQDPSMSENVPEAAKSPIPSDIPYRFKTVKNQIKNPRSPFATKFAEQKPKRKGHFNLAFGNMFCGYFESRSVRNNGILYFLKIFSKISVKKIGTRLLSRGVDAVGNVSFFVETKFATKSGIERVEFTILRGSVPLYWSQEDPLKPHKIIFDQDQENNDLAFKKHIESLQSKYGKVVVVDLLGHRKYEKLLSKLYKDSCLKNDVDYIHFDLNRHAEKIEAIKEPFYKRLNEFMAELRKNGSSETGHKYQNIEYKERPVCKDFDVQIPRFIPATEKWNAQPSGSTGLSGSTNPSGSFGSIGPSVPSGSSSKSPDENDRLNSEFTAVENEPDSNTFFAINSEANAFDDMHVVFRVNCLDCLDRTNIAQFLIFNFFDKFKFKVTKSMWVNNGNALSKMYTGSDALKSELHVKGKLSVLGRMNDLVISANRMINNRFTDKDKQSIIDTILGKKSN